MDGVMGFMVSSSQVVDRVFPDPDPSGYETDYVAWLDRQAALLRDRRFPEVDWENVIGEIEDLAKMQRGELRNRLESLAEHVLKLAASPAHDPRDGWTTTIMRMRSELENRLEDSPTLRSPQELQTALSRALPKGRRYAKSRLSEYGELTPEAAATIDTLELDAAKLLDENWWPEGVTPPA